MMFKHNEVNVKIPVGKTNRSKEVIGNTKIKISLTFLAGGNSNCNAERRHPPRRSHRGKPRAAE